MNEMNERLLSQLSNLAQALVSSRTPEEFLERLELVQRFNGKFDPALEKAVTELRRKLPRTLDRPSLEATAEKLLKGTGEPGRQAGRAVAWALELAPR